jgi:DNA repair protein RecO
MHITQGIILKREDFRERDEKVVLYTKEFGKLTVVARGAKRIEAKLRGNVDLFNFVDIFFVEGKYFPVLTGIDLRERFPGIGKDTFLYHAALLLAQSTVRIFEERARDEDFFTTLYWTLKKLSTESGEESEQEKISLRAWLMWKKFQIAILENQGYGQGLRRTKTLSPNAAQLVGMLRGSQHKNARLSRAEFWDIEEMFQKTFAYFFNYSPSSWIPEIS